MEGTDWGALAAVLLALGALFGVFFVVRRRRLIQDLPTSKIRGAFAGLNEFKGKVESDRPLTAIMSQAPCVWYRYRVEEEYRRQSNGSGTSVGSSQQGWTVVADGTEHQPFHLRDDTGRILVQPDGAKVHPTLVLSQTVYRGDPLYNRRGSGRNVRGSTGTRRINEYIIAVGAEIYALGPTRMHADAAELEVAKDRRAGPYLLSTRGQDLVERGLSGWLVIWFTLAFFAAGTAPFIWAHPDQPDPTIVGLDLLAVLAVLGLGWVLISYNGLVQLRQREARAWSLIEVQLSRRHDLIPRLAAAVEAYVRHETSTLEQVTAMRSGAIGEVDHVEGAPDRDEVARGADAATAQTSALVRLMALSEAYPELRADTVFDQLRAELIDTEDRIAMAREFFNNSVEALRNRALKFPENLVAKLGRFPTRNYFAAEGFERSVPVFSLSADPDGDEVTGSAGDGAPQGNP